MIRAMRQVNARRRLPCNLQYHRRVVPPRQIGRAVLGIDDGWDLCAGWVSMPLDSGLGREWVVAVLSSHSEREPGDGSTAGCGTTIG